MNDSAALLRMLEPTVRPVSTGKSGQAGPRTEPTNEPRFESLLHELAGKQDDTAQASPDDDTAAEENNQADQLSPLAQLERLENASLRQMIAQNSAHAPVDRQTGFGGTKPEA